jgi:glutamate mutase epsilon subunit
MDKIMSTRIDEAVIRHIGMLAKRLGTSKKTVLENAVRYYAEKIEAEQGFDVLTHTFGSWQRDKSAAETVQDIKDSMRKSQERYNGILVTALMSTILSWPLPSCKRAVKFTR